MGSGAGCYLAFTTLRLHSTGWNLVGGYALFAGLFLVFALIRHRDRALFLGAFVGLTLGVAAVALLVTG